MGPKHRRRRVSYMEVRRSVLGALPFHHKSLLTICDSDFEKTFIQCIVYNFNVLKELGDEAEVKAKGKVMTKGKDYVVEDGDIILIKAGAAKS